MECRDGLHLVSHSESVAHAPVITSAAGTSARGLIELLITNGAVWDQEQLRGEVTACSQAVLSCVLFTQKVPLSTESLLRWQRTVLHLAFEGGPQAVYRRDPDLLRSPLWPSAEQVVKLGSYVHMSTDH